jgi:hypothetical protein
MVPLCQCNRRPVSAPLANVKYSQRRSGAYLALASVRMIGSGSHPSSENIDY